MADDKKKDSKGPPKKDAKPAEGGGGIDTLGLVVGLVGALVFVAYVLSGRNLSSGEELPSWGELLSGKHAPEGSPLNPGTDAAPEDPIEIGATVVNAEEAVVRVDLSGAAIAGRQEARVKGVIKQGPVTAFGQEWYFVDYPEAPDGWVAASSVTPNVGAYTALHIVPILLDFFRPIAIGLALAVGILIAALWWKSQKQEQLAEKRAAEAYRAYLARTGRAPVAPVVPVGAPDGAAPAGLPTGASDIPAEWGWGSPTPKPPRENERWVHILGLLSSSTTSEWRQAIIEADIMLEEMLRAIGYDGVSIGDMLKNVDPADFVTLEKAWEAHKVRNQIAHRGMDFRVDRNAAERVIKLYEDVFREFNYL
jgi:hypothetical protein